MSKASFGSEILGLAEKLELWAVGYPRPLLFALRESGNKNSYQILVACLLSLRSRDTVTIQVAAKLLPIVGTPAELLAWPTAQLESLLRPLGFYRRKAAALQAVSGALLERFAGQVPADEASLLSLPGVGRKTANLVLGVAFGIPAICVDVHVHRISNRLGLVHTKTPWETELALKQILPRELWIDWNRYLVTVGQNICLPRWPRCSACPVKSFCQQVGI